LSFRAHFQSRASEFPRIRHHPIRFLAESKMLDDRYSAGLFDADGCVRIARWQKPNSTHVRYQVIATVSNCHSGVIEALMATYGGSIHTELRSLRNPNHRNWHAWHAGSKVASAFLRRVLPHLIVKKEEAELALALQEHINQTAYMAPGRPAKGGRAKFREDREEIHAFREDLYRRISELKKRSYPPLLSDGPSESVNGH
jgi:hypothetical protein